MARIIEFHVPWGYRKQKMFIPSGKRAKVITLCPRPAQRKVNDSWRILGLGPESAYFKVPGR
jgi:hypothetical protein